MWEPLSPSLGVEWVGSLPSDPGFHADVRRQLLAHGVVRLPAPVNWLDEALHDWLNQLCLGSCETSTDGGTLVRTKPFESLEMAGGWWHKDGVVARCPHFIALYVDETPPLSDTLFIDNLNIAKRLEVPSLVAKDLFGVYHDPHTDPDGYYARPLQYTSSVTGHTHPFVCAGTMLGVKHRSGGRFSDERMHILRFSSVSMLDESCRVRHFPGSLTIFDNHRLQHYALKTGAGKRVVRRVCMFSTEPERIALPAWTHSRG